MVKTEVDERTDSGNLFQREGAQELNDLFPALVLTLGTDKVIHLFDVGERDGSGLASVAEDVLCLTIVVTALASGRSALARTVITQASHRTPYYKQGV